jgi:DNA-binding NarL/FixJ family response regulator
MRLKGDYMPASSIRVLVAEDYPAFRRSLVSTVHSRADIQVVCEVADGSGAVQKARELQPDLILLDIGLPSLNGIEAARRIRSVSPNSKILFVSENHSSDVIEEALRTGALGYVVKSDAGSDLFPAVEAVLQGKEFVSSSVSVHHVNDRRDEHRSDNVSGKKVAPFSPHNAAVVGHHEVVFYSDDWQLLDRLSQFIAATLGAGNAAIVIATESHRDGLVRRLQAYGLEMSAGIEQGRYIALDAADMVATFVVNGMLDSVRFLESFGNLILKPANAAKGEHPRVALFGEAADLLWKRGNVEAAIQDEEICNQLTKRYDVAILCGYSLGNIEGGKDGEAFQRICAEHSAAYSP